MDFNLIISLVSLAICIFCYFSVRQNRVRLEKAINEKQLKEVQTRLSTDNLNNREIKTVVTSSSKQITNSSIMTNDYLSTLEIIVRQACVNGELESVITDRQELTIILNIQKALRQLGYEVSTGQSEQVFRMYSQNKYASWINVELNSVEDAILMLKEFCHDVRFGENHIGL